MRINRANSYGADQWIDLAEALLHVSASLAAFEERLLKLMPETEIYQTSTHRRYTLFQQREPRANEKLASIYLEL